MNKQNVCQLIGTVKCKPELSHTIFGENFYLVELEVPRKSGNVDLLPILISDRTVEDNLLEKLQENVILRIRGSIRSRSIKRDNDKTGLEIRVLANEVEVMEEQKYLQNTVTLEGILVNDGRYRKLEHRNNKTADTDICDLFVKVHRGYNHYDFIPVIMWGKNAKYAGKLTKDTEVKLRGRLQKRQFTKYIDDKPVQIDVYEVSGSQIEVTSLPKTSAELNNEMKK